MAKNKRPEPPLSDKQPYEFSKVHLHYEINMLHYALARLPRGGADIAVNNVLVESYAIHLRNLIEFLYWTPKLEDVNAVHFVTSEARWLESRGKIPKVLETAKGGRTNRSPT